MVGGFDKYGSGGGGGGSGVEIGMVGSVRDDGGIEGSSGVIGGRDKKDVDSIGE